jgi:hypothetical protein
MPLATTHSAAERTKRRRRILKMIAKGYKFREIGEKLGVTAGTISYYVRTSEAQNGTSAPKRAYHRRIQPIVLGADPAAVSEPPDAKAPWRTTFERRLIGTIDMLWSRLPLADKLAAISSLKESNS